LGKICGRILVLVRVERTGARREDGLTEVGADGDDEGGALEGKVFLLRVASGAEEFFEVSRAVHVATDVVQSGGPVEDWAT